jgi:RNA polymerase sigma-B factor
MAATTGDGMDVSDDVDLVAHDGGAVIDVRDGFDVRPDADALARRAMAAAPAVVPGGSTLVPFGPEARADYERALVEEYLSLADRIARRMAPPTVPLEDFVQAARLALVQAARRYDPQRFVPFPGYASVVVAGRLKHYLRDMCWDVRVPRGLQETWLRAGKAREELTHRLGRAPTVSELAAELDVDDEHLLASIPIGDAWTVTRFEGIGAVDDGEAWEPPDRSDAFGAIDDRLWLRDALRRLPERLQRVVHLYYVDEQPQRVIAEELGVSQMQISRLLARAIELLRREAPA